MIQAIFSYFQKHQSPKIRFLHYTVLLTIITQIVISNFMSFTQSGEIGPWWDWLKCISLATAAWGYCISLWPLKGWKQRNSGQNQTNPVALTPDFQVYPKRDYSGKSKKYFWFYTEKAPESSPSSRTSQTNHWLFAITRSLHHHCMTTVIFTFYFRLPGDKYAFFMTTIIEHRWTSLYIWANHKNEQAFIYTCVNKPFLSYFLSKFRRHTWKFTTLSS